jgi:hypothetical protein
MKSRYVVAGTAIGGAAAAYILLARQRQLGCGATAEESGASLLAGVGLPEGVQTVGTAVRSVAFAGMGAACLRPAPGA